MTTLPTPRQAHAVAEFIDKLQPAASANMAAGRGRLIFALDATASREPTWDSACRIQGEMFEATSAIGGLETQLVFYRGYSECKASRWVTTASALHQMMSRVICAGGETQIERVLSHALRETGNHKLGAVVFIGDCMEEHLDRLCRLAGELGSRGVPVFIFHEFTDPSSHSATAAFQQLASLSRGAYASFDLASAGRLKALLGAVAVYAAGGYAALEAYGRNQGGEVLRLLTHQMRGR